jgi:hypothetical protein
MTRVLLTTRCRDTGLYDYYRENAPRDFREILARIERLFAASGAS